jgi:hypothetical protein
MSKITISCLAAKKATTKKVAIVRLNYKNGDNCHHEFSLSLK